MTAPPAETGTAPWLDTAPEGCLGIVAVEEQGLLE